MKIIRILIFLFIINMISFAQDSGIIELTIFFTNDTNGHPLNFNAWQQESIGGMPARAALIKKLLGEKKDSNYLILDSGGIIEGRPESNMYDGLPDIAGMNAIGYDAAGIGTSEIRDSLKKFKDLNKKADFYFLCSNIKDKKGKEICDKYYIKKIGGFKGINIGIFSVINDEVINEISEEAREEIKFDDPIKTAAEIVEELKSDKNQADIIIALTYMGYYDNGSRIGSQSLANSVNGIDIIIDGKTGLKFDIPVEVKNTKICQAYKWGLYLGEIKLTIEDKQINNFNYKLHPINYQEDKKQVKEVIEEDKDVLKAITRKMPRFEKNLERPIAKMKEGSFDTKYVRFHEVEIGNLICDAILDYTKADIVFQNAGGIGEFTLEAGNINRNSFNELIIYDNSVVLLNMSGEEILNVLRYSMDKPGYGAFLQIGGIRFSYSKNTKEFSNITVNDNELDESKFYKVAINSWMANGGDGYIQFRNNSSKSDLNVLHREILYDYVNKLENIEPKLDGRMNLTE